MSESLFSNSAEKLRIFANISFWLYIIFCGIIGYYYASVSDSVTPFVIGIMAGFMSGWINTLIMHVFANIAENIIAIGKMVYKISENCPKNHEN